MIGAGVVIAVLTLLKILDLAAFVVLDRPFNVVTDRSLLGSGVGFVRDSVGTVAAIGAVLAAVALACAVVVCLPRPSGASPDRSSVAVRRQPAGSAP